MTSPTKFYHLIHITLEICSCDQSLVTLAFLWEKLSQPQCYKDLTRKTAFFEGWPWFKFNNYGLALGINLKVYTSVGKGLKLKVKKFWELIPTFVEVTGEKLVGGPFFIFGIFSRLVGSLTYVYVVLQFFKVGYQNNGYQVLKRWIHKKIIKGGKLWQF